MFSNAKTAESAKRLMIRNANGELTGPVAGRLVVVA